jgi:hypothetical protein
MIAVMPTDVHEKHLWLTPREIADELRVDVAFVAPSFA